MQHHSTRQLALYLEPLLLFELLDGQSICTLCSGHWHVVAIVSLFLDAPQNPSHHSEAADLLDQQT